MPDVLGKIIHEIHPLYFLVEKVLLLASQEVIFNRQKKPTNKILLKDTSNS